METLFWVLHNSKPACYLMLRSKQKVTRFKMSYTCPEEEPQSCTYMHAGNNTAKTTFEQLARQWPTTSNCSTLSLGDANRIGERFQ